MPSLEEPRHPLHVRRILRRSFSVWARNIVVYLVLGLLFALLFELQLLLLWRLTEPTINEYIMTVQWKPNLEVILKNTNCDWILSLMENAGWSFCLTVPFIGIPLVASTLFSAAYQGLHDRNPSLAVLTKRTWRLRGRSFSKRFRFTYFAITIFNILIWATFVLTSPFVLAKNDVPPGLLVVNCLIVLFLAPTAPICFLLIPTSVIERLGFLNTIKRSIHLTDQFRLRIYWLMVSTSTIILFVFFVSFVVAFILILLVHSSVDTKVFVSFFSFIAFPFINSFVCVTSTVCYYQLRTLKYEKPAMLPQQ